MISEIDFSILTDTWDMNWYDSMEKYNIFFNTNIEKKELEERNSRRADKEKERSGFGMLTN